MGKKKKRRRVIYYSEKDVARFESKYKKKGKKACWIWSDTRNNRGFGRISIKGHTMLAHRIAWAIDKDKGYIPRNVFIHHSCGNYLCVNPSHLYVGGPKERGRLMTERGIMKKPCFHCRDRQRDGKGGFILRPEDEAEIKRLYRTGVYTPKELMDHFRIDDSEIKRILDGVEKDITMRKRKREKEIDDLLGGRG